MMPKKTQHCDLSRVELQNHGVDGGYCLRQLLVVHYGSLSTAERDEQFKYIACQKRRFITTGWPVISIDTKKKELIGEFRNNGRTWRRHSEEVNEHDFPGVAKWRAVPFGIYDVVKNEGHVYVGISSDSPEFAVCSIAQWWKDEGCRVYPRKAQE
jgi:hypothetical protein